MGMLVGQLEDIVTVIAEGLARLGFDDDRAEGAVRLLEARMAMKPISAGLNDREAVGEGLAGRDTVVANAGDAIHLKRKDQAVPMDRG